MMTPAVPLIPDAAVGVPVTVAAGQVVAHVPVQALVLDPALSLSKRYRVRPLASTTRTPSGVLRVPRVVLAAAAVVGAAFDGAALAAVVGAAPAWAVDVDDFDELPQPASARSPATATAAPAAARRAVLGAVGGRLIVVRIMSSLGTGRAGPAVCDRRQIATGSGVESPRHTRRGAERVHLPADLRPEAAARRSEARQAAPGGSKARRVKGPAGRAREAAPGRLRL
jgi:hypothetical protein